MKIGYARVSTKDQKLQMQIAALEAYGCGRIFKERKSTGKDRPELDKMLSQLRVATRWWCGNSTAWEGRYATL
jgi:DNA invertase Pin-like site-specific DNA recombinase